MPDDAPQLGTIPYATPVRLDGEVVVVRRDRTVSIVFVAVGVTLLMVPKLFMTRPMDEGWFLMIPGGFMLAIALSYLVDRSPLIVLDERAFVGEIGNHIDVRWDQLWDAFIVYHHGSTYLVLRLIDPGAWEQPATLWNRPSFSRPAAVAAHDILLPLGGLDRGAAEILQEIRRRIEDAHRKVVVPVDGRHPVQSTA
jgi:hypothetical protein